MDRSQGPFAVLSGKRRKKVATLRSGQHSAEETSGLISRWQHSPGKLEKLPLHTLPVKQKAPLCPLQEEFKGKNTHVSSKYLNLIAKNPVKDQNWNFCCVSQETLSMTLAAHPSAKCCSLPQRKTTTTAKRKQTKHNQKEGPKTSLLQCWYQFVWKHTCITKRTIKLHSRKIKL